ncbi:MAG: hypothetical protein EP318_17255 [Rhodobacteraceae bacterium]|nr:MAG: hypothetical protein EP318_17255 [Paracoccaceae bacterium]
MRNIAIAALLILGALALYDKLFGDVTDLCKADPEVCPCLRLLPADKRVGLKFDLDESGKLRSVDLGGSKTRDDDPSPELAEAFVQCIERLRSNVEIRNFSRLNTSPLGQVAHQWTSAGGLQINLRPDSPDQIPLLNNLQIGPDAGLRWQILEAWCTGPMASCVDCGTAPADEDTVAVEIRLRSEGPLVREFWNDGWPPGGDHNQDWELVDDKGNRYLYACRP